MTEPSSEDHQEASQPLAKTFAELQEAQGTTGRVDPADLAIPDLTDQERAAFTMTDSEQDLHSCPCPVDPYPDDPFEWVCPDCGRTWELRSESWYQPRKPITEISLEEGRRLLDTAARRYLNMSGGEFMAAWDEDRIPNPDTWAVQQVASLLPFAR